VGGGVVVQDRVFLDELGRALTGIEAPCTQWLRHGDSLTLCCALTAMRRLPLEDNLDRYWQ
jgi:hypothetical protein